jgi:NTP pyrophosphatase (non-canonical NTP hydrolase)
MSSDSIIDLKPEYSLLDIQEYIKHVVETRGFADETPRDIMLLLVEEVGELAKSIRKYIGVKTDIDNNKSLSIQEEIADVFIYLVDLANSLNIDLYSAFYEKEQINASRTWK